MAAVVDNRTPNYDIPLPNADNWLSEDVIRLAQAITAFDQLIKTANDNIAARALLDHAHQISEITGLTDVLAQKAAYDHVHALAALSDVDVSIITVGQYLRWNGAKWVPGVVSADDIKAGVIDPARLPSIAITDTYVVASQAQMLVLDVQKGDIAVRTDLNRSYICSGTNPALLTSWTELLTPTDAVLSVAGLTGAITASALRTAIATATGIALMTAANAAAAQDAIGATATGKSLITAADAAAVRGIAGATYLGGALMTADTPAAARAAIDFNAGAAALSFNVIGSLLIASTDTPASAGDLIAGSSLTIAAITGTSSGSPATYWFTASGATGTWRCVGWGAGAVGVRYGATLWQRVS
ncbi:hypothetical protein GCM10019059_34980 [Camelimonas fluminis]|uniref:Uncharacterized protein n=1 Tax=Camelimonas fluminis TaxID=1576911 RepID=A0ABV7UFR3_9HYPH|nr:hypothetical protein [Camelimonas fluminis]GHE72322.1 hypothetical protein GCM10019059_34980 [Camelimonas fluminis]